MQFFCWKPEWFNPFFSQLGRQLISAAHASDERSEVRERLSNGLLNICLVSRKIPNTTHRALRKTRWNLWRYESQIRDDRERDSPFGWRSARALFECVRTGLSNGHGRCGKEKKKENSWEKPKHNTQSYSNLHRCKSIFENISQQWVIRLYMVCQFFFITVL